MIFRRRQKKGQIDPDEIFLDSVNLPQFDTQQFEGRLERAIAKSSPYLLGVIFTLVFGIFIWKAEALQVERGEMYRARSMSNTLRQIPVFGERGLILDRNGVELVTNDPERTYPAEEGLAHILGYVGYPGETDLAEQHYLSTEEYIGKEGAEKVLNSELRGVAGKKIIEVNAKGEVASENIYQPPLPGSSFKISIDSRVQKKLYEYIKGVAVDRGFEGGAGIIMDVRTGELIALTSYPEYDANAFTSGKDSDYISAALNDKERPLLNRALSGLYAPGSVVKPMMALAALTEKIISPEKQILSTGQISIPNPYDKTKATVFKDWKAHGYVDMRRAIAVSSDVYFYVIGGGFQGQAGLGISRIEKYFKMFGFGDRTGIELEGEKMGVIPNPEWKAKNFDGEAWYVGNTYHTSIGQYGLTVTPLEMVRAIAAVANRGLLLTPTIVHREDGFTASSTKLAIDPKAFNIVHEGMRLAVTEGTAAGLNLSGIEIAAKTGTAELGASKARVNSWVEGFFPYDDPHYAFVVVMERGVVHNTVGGVFVMRQLLDWMGVYTPEYFK
ncbi:MAG: penicillin-binding transpeptidase domain-containing protein [Patescibacteria group bacterium]